MVRSPRIVTIRLCRGRDCACRRVARRRRTGATPRSRPNDDRNLPPALKVGMRQPTEEQHGMVGGGRGALTVEEVDFRGAVDGQSAGHPVIRAVVPRFDSPRPRAPRRVRKTRRPGPGELLDVGPPFFVIDLHPAAHEQGLRHRRRACSSAGRYRQWRASKHSSPANDKGDKGSVAGLLAQRPPRGRLSAPASSRCATPRKTSRMTRILPRWTPRHWRFALARQLQLAGLEAADLVAQARGLLELEVGGGGVAHALLQLGDMGLQIVADQLSRRPTRRCRSRSGRARRSTAGSRRCCASPMPG